MKNLLIVIALLVSFLSCTSRTAVEAAKRQMEREAKPERTTTTKSNTYVALEDGSALKITVERIETPTEVLRFDSTVTHVTTGSVMHRTLITSAAN